MCKFKKVIKQKDGYALYTVRGFPDGLSLDERNGPGNVYAKKKAGDGMITMKDVSRNTSRTRKR